MATGLLLSGEALALFIGLFLIKKGDVLWNTKRNRLFLTSDFLAGIILGANYIFHYFPIFQFVVGIMVILSIVVHFKRTTEFLLKKNNAFCFNKALFWVNNLKLVLLFGALFIVLPF